jgi:hypothetical protein
LHGEDDGVGLPFGNPGAGGTGDLLFEKNGMDGLI